jgi:YesN/AraC family two-component response regulator
MPGVKRRFRLLLVDDEPAMRAFIAEALAPLMDVVEAGSVDEALTLLGKSAPKRFDLAILDCRLPIRDRISTTAGLELLETLSARWPNIRTVVITGYGTDDMIVDALRGGARDFLKKPFTLDQLRAAVERALGRSLERATDPARDRIAAAVQYLQDHLAEPVSLDRLSGVAGMSRSHFSRMFRSTLGVPVRAYVRELRLMRARTRLAHSSDSLTAIARAVGFYDLPHFHREFRRRFGESPADFRRTSSGSTARNAS